MKKHYKLILLIILIISITAGGFTYYINRKEKINILDYLSIIEKGADTKGTISVTSNKEKVLEEISDIEMQQNILLTLNNLTYNYDKENELSNNDIVTISIDTNLSHNKNVINKYKISPSQKSLEHKITKLLKVPEWHEVSDEDKNIITEMIQADVQATKEKFYAFEGGNLFEFFNKEVPIEVTPVLDSVYYQKNLEECNQEKDTKILSCGTIVYIYRYDYTFVESRYSFNSTYKPKHFIHQVTNIYMSDTVEKNYFIPEKMILDDEMGFYWFTDIDYTKQNLDEFGYEQIQ